MKDEIEALGIHDVQPIATGLLEAGCAPFHEQSFVNALKGKVAGISYAQTNRVVRLVDFSPGWRVRKLA